MKIYGYVQGDPQAGIDHQSFTLDIHHLPLDEDTFNNEQREQFRVEFKRAMSELFDSTVTVQFEDECPDCGFRDGRHHTDCPLGLVDPDAYPPA